MRTKQVLLLMLVVALAGCSPYVFAAKETYEVAADPRSLVTQATDSEAELHIKAARGLVCERHQRDRGVLSPGSGGTRWHGAVGLTSRSGGGEDRPPDLGRETSRDVFRVPSARLGERHRHQGTNQSRPRRGPLAGIQPGRHRRLRGPCCSSRSRRLTSECSEVHFRRARGEWCRVCDVLYPDGYPDGLSSRANSRRSA